MGILNLPSKSIEEAKTDIINSIALMEAGIAQILAAEGEKLQSANGTSESDPQKKLQAASLDKLLEVNASVESLITTLTMLETLLQKKLALVTNNTSNSNL